MIRDQIVCCDCRKGLRRLETNSIPLTVTSPPWDAMKNFERRGPWIWEVFEDVANELLRVTRPGGMVCWHMADQVKDFAESCSSYRQVLYFVDQLGFQLYQTLVIDVPGGFYRDTRYGNAVQHVFVFSKGRPENYRLLRDRENVTAGAVNRWSRTNADGQRLVAEDRIVQAKGYRTPLWRYACGTQTDLPSGKKHPAMMQRDLAHDLIWCYSGGGDLILDPFAGSGTTAEQCVYLGRQYLGFEVNSSYCQIARKRVRIARRKVVLGE